MLNLKTALIAGLMLGATAFTAPAAAATLFLNPSSPVDGITWTVTNSNPNTTLGEWAYFDANPGSQSAASVKTLVQGWLGVSLSAVVSQVDAIGGGSSYTYNGPNADTFYFHIGGGAFAFIFNDPVTSFTFTQNGTGLSNLRVYNCTDGCPDAAPPPPGEVPLPAAVWLMGTMLAGGAGFGAWRRRRKNIPG